MTDENKLRKQIEDGQHAENVLENPVFMAIGEEIAKDYARDFKGDDLDKAMEARQQIRVFETLLTKLTIIQKRGKTAAMDLNVRQERKNKGLPIDINSLQGIA